MSIVSIQKKYFPTKASSPSIFKLPAKLLAKFSILTRLWLLPLYLGISAVILFNTNDCFASELLDKHQSSICREQNDKLECPFQKTSISGREILYSLPQSENNASKKTPVVLLFQGSATPIEFSRHKNDRFHTYYELETIENLLNHGYAVIVPRPTLNLVWDTNLFPWSMNYQSTADYAFMLKILNYISDGSFGNLDAKHIYAAGFSSGGYQSSRMAITFPEQIRAVAIQSASYATCVGFMCWVGLIPDNHPPTLFLHGRQDDVVPISTMKKYAQALLKKNIPFSIWVDEHQGHEWSIEAPQKILNWFDSN